MAAARRSFAIAVVFGSTGASLRPGSSCVRGSAGREAGCSGGSPGSGSTGFSGSGAGAGGAASAGAGAGFAAGFGAGFFFVAAFFFAGFCCSCFGAERSIPSWACAAGAAMSAATRTARRPFGDKRRQVGRVMGGLTEADGCEAGGRRRGRAR